jgi:hypothetical protein
MRRPQSGIGDATDRGCSCGLVLTVVTEPEPGPKVGMLLRLTPDGHTNSHRYWADLAGRKP